MRHQHAAVLDSGDPRTRDAYGHVVALFDPLRRTRTSEISVRIIEARDGERRLDIRQFVETDTFTGFTRKGVVLAREEFEALLDQRAAIFAALEESSGQ